MQKLNTTDQNSNRYRVLLFALGLGVMVSLGWIARDELSKALENVNPAVFLIAVLLGLVSTIFYGIAFANIARKHAAQASRPELVGAFLLSQPAKYVPGKVWTAAMQTASLSGRASLAVTAVSNIELMIFGILQMSALGLGCALWKFNAIAAIAIWIAGLGASLGLLALPTATWMSLLPERLTNILGVRPPSTEKRSPRTPKLLFISALCIAANFAASWCMVASFGPSLNASDQMLILSALYLGFASSILALPVPAGVGVREVAAVAIGMIVAPEIAPSLVAAATLVARLWQVAVDVGATLAGALLLRLKP